MAQSKSSPWAKMSSVGDRNKAEGAAWDEGMKAESDAEKKRETEGKGEDSTDIPARKNPYEEEDDLIIIRRPRRK